jgi:two-component SAPR family response regulator
LDGRSTLVRIRAIEKEKGINYADRVKVIMTTGLKNIETEFPDMNSLCDAIIPKPVRRDSLKKILDKILGSNPIPKISSRF